MIPILGRREARIVAIVIAVGVVLGIVVVALGLPLREVIILGYLLVGPGAAIVWLARITDRAMQLSLVVPLSLAVDAMVATGLLYAGIWSPPLALVLVGAITVVIVLMGARERPALVALVALTLLPPVVLLTGQL